VIGIVFGKADPLRQISAHQSNIIENRHAFRQLRRSWKIFDN